MDPLGVKNMSLDDRDELVEIIKEKRNRARLPDTLEDITIRAVTQNCDFFMNRVENPLVNLPNTLVQKILVKIAEARDRRKFLVPKDKELPFVLQLLNPNVTEFDCTEFSNYSRSNDEVYYKHLLDNCPRVSKISKMARHVYSRHCEELPVLELCTWQNLRQFSLRGYFCNNETMRLIQENLPKLEGMEVFVSLVFFNMEGVEHLSKMENLKYLFVNVAEGEKEQVPELIAHCAGRTPRLQKFDFDDMLDSNSKFIELFGQLYSNKKLQLKVVRLRSDFQGKWPSNLTTEKLVFHGEFPPNALNNLQTFPTLVPTLNFESVPSSQVYTIVEALGLNVLTLDFNEFSEDDLANSKNPDKLNMYRVLASCPNLENLSYGLNTPVESGPKYGIKASHFKNYKSFHLSGFDWDEDELECLHKEMLQIFKMYLLGSENMDAKLSLASHSQLKLVLEVLTESSTCLSHLQKVEMEIYEDGMLEKAVQVASLLVQRSPLLEKIKLNGCSLDPRFIPRDLRRRHKWFTDFVEAVNVKFRVIDQTKPEAEDSSMGQFSDLEDQDNSGSDSDHDDGFNGWDDNSDDYEDVPSDNYTDEDDDEEYQNGGVIQCPVN